MTSNNGVGMKEYAGLIFFISLGFLAIGLGILIRETSDNRPEHIGEMCVNGVVYYFNDGRTRFLAPKFKPDGTIETCSTSE